MIIAPRAHIAAYRDPLQADEIEYTAHAWESLSRGAGTAQRGFE